MKKGLALGLVSIFFVFIAVSGSFAASYSSVFPPGTDNFTFDDQNDFVTYTFTATGLESVVSVLFNPNVVSYNLPPPDPTKPEVRGFMVIDILVNGQIINSEFGNNPMWVIRPEGAGTKKIAFGFEDIVGHGTYTITWDVNRFTPDASVVLSYNTDMWLFGSAPCPCPAPIPGAVWLLGSGLVGLMGLRRKLRR